MKQGYNSRLDEHLGSKNGKTKMSMVARRAMSKGASKKMTGHAYSAVKSMKK
jgi:hypothetical protein